MNNVIEQLMNSEHSATNINVKPSYLFLSAHDFRSPRKASVHFIAEELVLLGKTRFFSIRYSFLSRFKRDPRMSLDAEANREAVYQVRGFNIYVSRGMFAIH